MATATELPTRPMSVEEFLALPDDGMERMLIRGRLLQKPFLFRDRWHAAAEANIAAILWSWLEAQPKPRRGMVYSGQGEFHLERNPDTIVGLDVAYVSPDSEANQSEDPRHFVGPPVLAVEILSPSDKLEEITAKVDCYLAAGVPLVWIVDPHFRTVTVHRPSVDPRMFSGAEELLGDPHLPGFRVAAARIFER
ncbi:MAG: Uma2 family endonuclease [Pirellulales bacterium]